jgi:hypothetical protein
MADTDARGHSFHRRRRYDVELLGVGLTAAANGSISTGMVARKTTSPHNDIVYAASIALVSMKNWL